MTIAGNSNKLRIFSISHSSVVKDYRQRFSAYADCDNVEVTLLTPVVWRQFNRQIQAPPPDESEGFTLIRQQPFSWGIPFHGLRNASHIYPGLSRLIAQFKPHILEVWAEPFSAVCWQALSAFKACSCDGLFYFFSAQNVEKWRPPPYSWFEKTVFQSASGCLAMNEDVHDVLLAKGWKGTSTVVPLGLTPEKFEKIPPVSLPCGFSGPVIGYLGKLDYQKGVLDLLVSITQLRKAEPNSLFSLLVVGGGPLKDEVDQFSGSGLVPTLIVPPVSHEDVPSYLSAMDIVVVPSRTLPHLKEQFGRVVIEAMASGKPVIVSDSGELAKVVGDGGLVFQEGNPDELEHCLKELIHNADLCKELGEKGRERVRRNYSWSQIAQQVISLYRRSLQAYSSTL